MELKDTIISVIGFLGWVWAIAQFILNRRNQKADKRLDKRFEVYSEFMIKMDEINNNLRTDPSIILGISNDFMSKMLNAANDDTIDVNKVLLDFNSDIVTVTQKAIVPLIIVNQEINRLKMVCSQEMLPKIDEYKILVTDYIDEFQIALNKISNAKDLDVTAKELTNIGNPERNLRLTVLWKEIEEMMRIEIGYYSK